MKTTSTYHSDTVSRVKLKLTISDEYDLLVRILWVRTKLSDIVEWKMLCDWVEIRSLSDKATLGTHTTQTQ